MKVLILGGTGAMGVHLVQLLSNSGVEVVVTSRKSQELDGNVKFIQGNAHDIGFLQLVLCDHWDAIVDFMSYSTENFNKRVNMLLNATKQYVFLSSSRVYADSESPLVEASPRLKDCSEDEEFLSTDEYSLRKARQEDILRNSGRKNWTIIRPYITYSENRLQLGVLEKEEWLYRALHGRSIVFSSDIVLRNTTMTYGLDVSKGIQSVIGSFNSFGDTFHITTDDSNSWDHILGIYLDVLTKHLGYRPKVKMLDLDSFLKIKPTKYQIIFDRFFNRRFDNTSIGHYIDIDSFVKIDEGIVACLNEFLKYPKYDSIDWKYEALKDRKTAEHTSLTEIRGIKKKMRYLYFRYL